MMMTRLQAAQIECRKATASLAMARAAAKPELQAVAAPSEDSDDDEYINELEAIEERHGIPQAAEAYRDAKIELIAAAQEQTTRSPEFQSQSPEQRNKLILVFAQAQMYPNTARKLLDLCMRMA